MKLSKAKRLSLFVLVIIITSAFICINFASADTTSVVAPEPSRTPVSDVAIVQSTKAKATDLKYEDIKAMVKSAVDQAGGFGGLIQDGQTVVLKPNLVDSIDYTKPGWQGNPLVPEANGCTTDWRVTKAVVELVRELNPNGKVYVMEGASVPTKKAMQALKYTPEYIPGVTEFLAIEEDSGAWKDTNSSGLVKVSLPEGLIHTEYYLNKKYQEADVLISIPALKNHWSAAVSGGIKNVSIGATPATIYGASRNSPGRNSMVTHDDKEGSLHKWIHDFFSCRPVDFVVMDGLQGVQNGPTPCYEISGTTDLKKDQKNMRLIMAGRDAVAVDTIESLVMGWDPQSVKYLQSLDKDGAGNANTAKINVVGKQVDQVRASFAGKIPVAGGAKITDKTAPTFKLGKYAVKKGILTIPLTAAKDTTEVEVLVNGKRYFPAITKSFSKVTVDLSTAVGKGKQKVSVWAYDRVLNRYYKDFTITNDVDKKDPYATTYGNYNAPKAASAPTIDGKGDDKAWEKAKWADIKTAWKFSLPSPNDFTGRYKIVWTPEKLYYLVEVTDDKLSPANPNPTVKYYDYDVVEVFMDEDASGGNHQNSFNAFAYHIDQQLNAMDLGRTNSEVLNLKDHIKGARTNNGNVYTWEIAIDIYNDKYDPSSKDNKPVQLYEGKVLGAAIAYCDSDAASPSVREGFIGSIEIPEKYWNKSTSNQSEWMNVAWQNASIFGKLTLKP